MNAIECLAGALEQSQTIVGMLIENLQEADYQHVPCEGANNLRWILRHLVEADRDVLARLGVAPPGENASFEQVRGKLIDAVRAMEPTELDRRVDDFPRLASTLGALLGLTALHTMLHAGQVSTIRRSLSYPPVF